MSSHHAPTRRGDPDTSFAAADAVTPRIATIRIRVLNFALSRPEGFIDEELSAHFNDADRSSFRTRRNELQKENLILDTGRRRRNSLNLECVVWAHRDYVENAPDVRHPTVTGTQPTQPAKSAGQALIPALEREALGLRRSGFGPLAGLLDDTVLVLRELTR